MGKTNLVPLPAYIETNLGTFFGPMMVRQKELDTENKQLEAGIRSLNSNIEHKVCKIIFFFFFFVFLHSNYNNNNNQNRYP